MASNQDTPSAMNLAQLPGHPAHCPFSPSLWSPEALSESPSAQVQTVSRMETSSTCLGEVCGAWACTRQGLKPPHHLGPSTTSGPTPSST